MKKVLLIILFISTLVFSKEGITLKIDPAEPVVGDNFSVIFKVSTADGNTPAITFDPKGLDIINKSDRGMSTRSTYINGKFTSERSFTVVYDVVANKEGYAFLRNIRADVGTKVLKHSTKSITILKEARKNKSIFVLAVPDKEEAYVGESIVVQYYLYNKIRIANFDVKKFPKLDNMIKRFHDIRKGSERIQYKGEMFERRLLYTQQVYSEKPGNIKIDPIRLNVHYYKTSGDRGAFGNFGFGLRNTSTRSVSSKSIQIPIKPLDPSSLPTGFTGLIEDHEFNITFNKTKFLANEPVEIKLSVKGKGALELFEAPKILTDSSFEEFEATSDLQVNQDFTATKTFEYTYLARNNYESAERTIDFLMFDPVTNDYIKKTIIIPALRVAGGETSTSTTNDKSGSEEVAGERYIDRSMTLLAPHFDGHFISKVFNGKLLNIFLGLVLLGVIFIRGREHFVDDSYSSVVDVPSKVTYKDINQIIRYLEPSSHESLVHLIGQIDFSEKTEKELKTVASVLEESYMKNIQQSKKLNTSVIKEIKVKLRDRANI